MLEFGFLFTFKSVVIPNSSVKKNYTFNRNISHFLSKRKTNPEKKENKLFMSGFLRVCEILKAAI